MKQILKAIVPIRKPEPEPTLGERYGAALALQSAATAVFQGVVNDLTQAETELSEIARDAGAEQALAAAEYEANRQALVDAHEKALDDLEAHHVNELSGLSAIADMAYGDAYTAYERAEEIQRLIA
ncbi:hypothetical protein OG474_29935 [Kribbella sp. NBC_01505]|uniref:hypothetical protein n=1 Tax=Kribbella sp. NBC_01505 TaxID=2903580 RepID=UPI00386F1AB9